MSLAAAPQPDRGPAPEAAPPLDAVARSRRASPQPRLGDLIVAAVLYAACLFVVVIVTGGGPDESAEVEPGAFFWFQFLDDGILTSVALLFGYFRFPGSWPALGFRSVGLRWAVAGVGGGVLAQVAAWALTGGLDRLGFTAPDHMVDAVLKGSRGLGDTFLLLVAVSILVPIGEETFFRGYAYRLLRARYGITPALVATAILFALVHGVSVAAWLPLVPVGLIFGVLAERSGSLAPAMLGHAVVNGVAVLLG
jgi:membrane protease YdiL (CAAX protease family)